jgi:hypothetical protein
MSQNIIDEKKELSMKLVDAVQTNFNSILSNAGIKLENDLEFEKISVILDDFIEKFSVIKDKKNRQYEKSKKRFSKVLNYNEHFIRNNLVLSPVKDEVVICPELLSHSETFFKSFYDKDDNPTENWNLLHIVVVSYISYLKQEADNCTVNYRGMIDKLMDKIEEFTIEDNSEISDDSDEENEDTDDQNEINYNASDAQELLNSLKNKIPQTEKAPTVIKGLLGDIKSMLKSNDNMDSKSIVDISRDLSSKYQTMIESGDVNINDLLSGVFGLLNDPDAINGEFDDIDSSKLPDPSKILSEMSNDPSLKQAMGILGAGKGGKGGMSGGLDMSMLGSVMAGMMGGDKGSNSKVDPNAPKTVFELEKEIERMMREVAEAETEDITQTENKVSPVDETNTSSA